MASLQMFKSGSCEKCNYSNVLPSQGDSGGPLVCQDEYGTWKHVGAASYVWRHCNVSTKPSVFAETKPYVEWIKSKIGLK